MKTIFNFKKLALILGIGICIGVIGNVLLANNEKSRYAKSSITTNIEIKNKVGEVSSLRFTGWSMHGGYSRYRFKVYGRDGNITVVAKFKIEDNVGQIDCELVNVFDELISECS